MDISKIDYRKCFIFLYLRIIWIIIKFILIICFHLIVKSLSTQIFFLTYQNNYLQIGDDYLINICYLRILKRNFSQLQYSLKPILQLRKHSCISGCYKN